MAASSQAAPTGANRALWWGIAFSLAFTALIAWAGPRLDAIQLLPDQGAAWYFWKLPEPSVWTRVSVWSLYLLHQVALWALIAYAQKNRPSYTTGLHKFNVLALGVTAVFILLHFAQTHLFYDGLAQDVSVFSSQGSVIVLLVWVLLMENPRRGLFFGRKAPIGKEIIAFARKYHGYFFAWATVYTFWFHPMVSTPGHLVGFIYMFLLLLQGSLFFTRVHVNKYWTFVQEGLVAVHGTLVAVAQGAGLWPMFFFGFTGIFVITQMYGLGLAIFAAYAAAVLWVYSERGWAQLNEIVRIPLIDYLAVFVLAGLFGGGLWIARRVRARREPMEQGATA